MKLGFMKKNLVVLLLAAVPVFAAEGQWILKQSTLTYHVSHPLHQVDGISHAACARGFATTGCANF